MEPADRTPSPLSRGQRAVVEHEGGPCRVTGGFGTGKTTALQARAARLELEGRRALVLSARDVASFAVDVLRRNGRPVSTLSSAEQVAMVSSMAPSAVPADEVARALTAFQASFLGDEELRVHADAAGCLDEAETLIALTDRYLSVLTSRNRVDAGGAVVQASLLLRDHEVLAAERARLDELLVDDFQLASFGTNRLVSQLCGPGSPVALTVAGNEEAAVATDPLASPWHLARFERRFGGALDVTLSPPSFRSPGVPTLRIVDDLDEARRVAAETIARAGEMGMGVEETAVVSRDVVEAAVSREWPMVIVPEATDGRWPSPRPAWRWFDAEVFHGPDVPDQGERDRRWFELERRRFLVATTRATRFLVVIGEVPVSPFVSELVK